ncbi:MAG: DUF99 family protein [Candidatus Lokiarchaeota archaeon]|nr:DUF99 family protein [Candidatus Lokiarchaeota archaeon]
MKDNPIVFGFDDATFQIDANSNETYLIGVICQGVRIVRIEKEIITIDGMDATEKLIDIILRNSDHVQYILTHTITFGGFNIINMNKIFEKTDKPIIAITEKEVNIDSVKKALIKKFPYNYKQKFDMIFQAGNLYETKIDTAAGESKIFYHVIGIDVEEVEKLFPKICIDSKLPEAVRIAHLIGRAFRNY